MDAIHARLSGFTASFRHPLTLTGVQISTPVPAFSTLLGIISACAGRTITPKDTRIGFEFMASTSDREMERTNRLQYERGILREHREGQSIVSREVHFGPVLDLYVTNTGLRNAFEAPAATPCLGRSQDVAWIDFVRQIDLEQVRDGMIGPTLLPQPFPMRGLILRLPEWMENDSLGYVRRSGPFSFFMAGVPTQSSRMHVAGPNLFHPSDAQSQTDAVYIHQWSNRR